MLEEVTDIFVLLNHIKETSVVLANVKANVPVQLAQTDRAEMQVVLLMFHLLAVAPTLMQLKKVQCFMPNMCPISCSMVLTERWRSCAPLHAGGASPGVWRTKLKMPTRSVSLARPYTKFHSGFGYKSCIVTAIRP